MNTSEFDSVSSVDVGEISRGNMGNADIQISINKCSANNSK